MVILVVFNSFNVVKILKKTDLVARQKPPFYTTIQEVHSYYIQGVSSIMQEVRSNIQEVRRIMQEVRSYIQEVSNIIQEVCSSI